MHAKQLRQKKMKTTVSTKNSYIISTMQETAVTLTNNIGGKVYFNYNNYNGELKRLYGDFYKDQYDIQTVKSKCSNRGSRKNYVEDAMISYLDRKMNKTKYASASMSLEKKNFIRNCVNNLPDIERNIIFMRYWLSFSVNEIAKYMGLSIEAVKKSLELATLKLKNKFQISMEVIYDTI